MEMFQIFPQPNWQIKNHGMFYSPIMVILKYTTSVEAQNKDFPPVLQMDFSISLVPQSVQQADSWTDLESNWCFLTGSLAF